MPSKISFNTRLEHAKNNEFVCKKQENYVTKALFELGKRTIAEYMCGYDKEINELYSTLSGKGYTIDVYKTTYLTLAEILFNEYQSNGVDYDMEDMLTILSYPLNKYTGAKKAVRETSYGLTWTGKIKLKDRIYMSRYTIPHTDKAFKFSSGQYIRQIYSYTGLAEYTKLYRELTEYYSVEMPLTEWVNTIVEDGIDVDLLMKILIIPLIDCTRIYNERKID